MGGRLSPKIHRRIAQQCFREAVANSSSQWVTELQVRGFEVIDAPMNARSLRDAYAREFGVSLSSGHDFVGFLARTFKPDIILAKGLNLIPPLDELRASVSSRCLLVGHATDSHGISRAADFHYVFPGCTAIGQQLDGMTQVGPVISNGLDTRLLRAVRRPATPINRAIFIGNATGSKTPDYQVRQDVLERLHASGLVDIWTPSNFSNHQVHAPPRTHARQIYMSPKQIIRAFSRYAVVIHVPADPFVSPPCSAALRLYEGTASGAALATLASEDLAEQFQTEFPAEVAVFTADSAVEVVRGLLARPASTAELARRGKQRTLASHKISDRATIMSESLAALG